MRLTNTIRDAFVRAAMSDVPQVDYEEQAQKIGKAAISASLPASVQKLIKDPIASEYLNREYITMPRYFSNFYFYTQRNDHAVLQNKHPEAWAQITELHAKNDQQSKERRELESKLRAVANSVTTRKALVAALPEFEKYLPDDEEKAIRTLPVVTNVVADFAKAGWPKDQKKAA